MDPDATTLGDLVADGRDHGGATALRHPGGSYSYDRFRRTARKTGNFFSHEGVRAGHTVGVATDPAAPVALALYGAALLGAATRFGPPADADARVVVAPTSALDEYTLPAGGRLVGYGDSPSNPRWAHFERDVWSENPGFPETPVDPESAALTTGSVDYSHETVLNAARAVAEDADLGPGDVVAVRTSLAHPGTVVAGLVAPLLVGATVLFPGDDLTGTVAVADGFPAEERRIRVNEVPLSPATPTDGR